MDQTFEERHRQMVLREELKAIRTELGLEKPQTETLLAKCKERIAALKLPEHAKKVIEEEMVLTIPPTCSFNRKQLPPPLSHSSLFYKEKLKQMQPSSPDYNIVRTYIDWLTLLPWGIHSVDQLDMKYAQGKKLLCINYILNL